jgi:hypothetical protein
MNKHDLEIVLAKKIRPNRDLSLEEAEMISDIVDAISTEIFISMKALGVLIDNGKELLNNKKEK